jgi:hypothetical protein
MATIIFRGGDTISDSRLYILGALDRARNLIDAVKIGLAKTPKNRANDVSKKYDVPGRKYRKNEKNVFVILQSRAVYRDLAEGIEHMAQVYAYVKYGKLPFMKAKAWSESGTSEWFAIKPKQAQAMIMNAFKMAKKLDYDVLALTTYALDYMEKNNKPEPKDWSWIEYVRFAQARTAL